MPKILIAFELAAHGLGGSRRGPAPTRNPSKLPARLLESQGLTGVLQPPARQRPLLDSQRVGQDFEAECEWSDQHEVEESPQQAGLKVADLLGDPLPGLPSPMCESSHPIV